MKVTFMYPEESAIKVGDKYEEYKNKIIDILETKESAKTSEIAEAIGLRTSRTRDYLRKMVDDHVIIAKGENRNRLYMLKDRA